MAEDNLALLLEIWGGLSQDIELLWGVHMTVLGGLISIEYFRSKNGLRSVFLVFVGFLFHAVIGWFQFQKYRASLVVEESIKQLLAEDRYSDLASPISKFIDSSASPELVLGMFAGSFLAFASFLFLFQRKEK